METIKEELLEAFEEWCAEYVDLKELPVFLSSISLSQSVRECVGYRIDKNDGSRVCRECQRNYKRDQRAAKQRN